MGEYNLQAHNSNEYRKLWEERIIQCRNSGLSVKEWCASQDISYNTYFKWQKKIFHTYVKPEEPQFYEISSYCEKGTPLVTLRNGDLTAEIFSGADASLIALLCKEFRSC